MKKLISITVISAVACVMAVFAAPPTAITNYYPGTVIVSNTFTNAGDSGLSVSNAYICLPLASITNSEYTAALVTNDVRPFVSSIIKALATSIAGQTATNRFSSFSVSEGLTYPTATNRVVHRSISEQQTITITPGYPTE